MGPDRRRLRGLEGEFQRPADAPATARPGPTPQWLFAEGDGARARLWDLTSLPGARPLLLRRAGSLLLASAALDPAGDWLVVAWMDKPYESTLGSCSGIELRDLDTGKAQPLPAFGDCVWGFALSGDGQVVTPAVSTAVSESAACRGGAAPPPRLQGRGPVRRHLAGPPLGGLGG